MSIWLGFFFFFFFFFGLLGYVYKSSHLLMMLLSLEFMAVVIFFVLYGVISYLSVESYVLMMYLVFCVCEGVLGLCLLVCIIRGFGNNYVSSLGLLKC